VAPQGSGWNRRFDEFHWAAFHKLVGTGWKPTNLVVATVQVFRVPGELASLLERLDRSAAEPVSARALGFSESVPIAGLQGTLDPSLGRGCVRYQATILGSTGRPARGAVRRPAMGAVRGARCVHPARPEVGIDLRVVDTPLEKDAPPAVAPEADAFLRSLAFTTRQPLLPLVRARHFAGVLAPTLHAEWRTVDIGASGVWGCEDFGIHRMDRSTGGILAIIEPDGGRCLRLAIGAKAVWAVRGPYPGWPEDPTGVLRIDPRTEQVVATIPIKAWQIAADEDAVWTVGPQGVSRIDPETNAVRTVLPSSAVLPWGHEPPPFLLSRPRALDPFSRVLLVAGAGDAWALSRSQQGTAVRIDGRTGQVVASIVVGQEASSIGMGKDAVWITRSADGTVVRVSPATNRITDVIPVGARPTAATAADGGIWVAHQGTGDNSVSRIDPETRRVTATVPVGRNGRAWSEGSKEPVLGLAVDDESLWVQFPDGIVRVDPEGEVVLDRSGIPHPR
jgi:YVTN family beta-propeller protein